MTTQKASAQIPFAVVLLAKHNQMPLSVSFLRNIIHYKMSMVRFKTFYSLMTKLMFRKIKIHITGFSVHCEIITNYIMLAKSSF